MVSFFQSMSAMVARKSEGSLAVVVQNKKVRLEEKSRYRDQGDMILLQPSGSGKLIGEALKIVTLFSSFG